MHVPTLDRRLYGVNRGRDYDRPLGKWGRAPGRSDAGRTRYPDGSEVAPSREVWGKFSAYLPGLRPLLDPCGNVRLFDEAQGAADALSRRGFGPPSVPAHENAGRDAAHAGRVAAIVAVVESPDFDPHEGFTPQRPDWTWADLREALGE